MKMDFQTPNSNSCKRSTTNIMNRSKPVWLSLSEKAFCSHVMSSTQCGTNINDKPLLELVIRPSTILQRDLRPQHNASHISVCELT